LRRPRAQDLCSFPRQADSHVFDALHTVPEAELELVRRETLGQRLRSAGAASAHRHADGYAPNSRSTPTALRRRRAKSTAGLRARIRDQGHVALIKAERAILGQSRVTGWPRATFVP